MPSVLLPCFAALVAVSQALVFDPEDIISEPEDIQKLLVDWQLVSPTLFIKMNSSRERFASQALGHSTALIIGIGSRI